MDVGDLHPVEKRIEGNNVKRSTGELFNKNSICWLVINLILFVAILYKMV